MKKITISTIVLAVLSFLVAGVSILLLEDTIPVHFGVDGKPDGYGSKYLILLFPILSTVIIAIMHLVCKVGKVSANYQKYLLVTGVALQSMFLVLSVVFSVFAFLYKQEEVAVDANRVVVPLMGLLLIVVGNYSPKVEKNRTLGIKTSWALYNEVTWQKSNRFMGIGGVVLGCILLAFGWFMEGTVG